MLVAAALAFAIVAVLLVLVLVRLGRNIGLLDLEEQARRRGLAYVPVSREIVDQLKAWSKPVRIRFVDGHGPYLLQMQVESVDGEPAVPDLLADVDDDGLTPFPVS